MKKLKKTMIRKHTLLKLVSSDLMRRLDRRRKKGKKEREKKSGSCGRKKKLNKKNGSEEKKKVFFRLVRILGNTKFFFIPDRAAPKKNKNIFRSGERG